MKPAAFAAACALAALPAAAIASPLALPMPERTEARIERRSASEAPADWLAQRTITRAWGPSEDSVYTEVQIPDWKSEPAALLASAVLPGAGQLYAGEGSGWVFLAAEAAGWTFRTLAVRRADDRRDRFTSLVGDPYAAASGWSFERYRQATGGDASWLETLWASDREAFYLELDRGLQYAAGFRGGPDASAEAYRGLRGEREDALRRARMLDALLMIHHLASAWDALRAARFHNLPLRRSLPVQFGSRWSGDSPGFTASLVRRF